MFNIRLKTYREKLHLNKKEMAEKLNVCESYYSLIENNKRNPSQTIIEKLVLLSELPEEYWIYGINKDEYVKTRDDFKSLKKALDTILELDPFDNVDNIFVSKLESSHSTEALLISALKADIQSIIDKRKANNSK